MNAKTQIFQAAILGTAAFNNGIKCAPALDAEFMKMLAGRQIGETPKGEASSVKLMKTWTHNWTLANLAKMANA